MDWLESGTGHQFIKGVERVVLLEDGEGNAGGVIIGGLHENK